MWPVECECECEWRVDFVLTRVWWVDWWRVNCVMRWPCDELCAKLTGIRALSGSYMNFVYRITRCYFCVTNNVHLIQFPSPPSHYKSWPCHCIHNHALPWSDITVLLTISLHHVNVPGISFPSPYCMSPSVNNCVVQTFAHQIYSYYALLTYQQIYTAIIIFALKYNKQQLLLLLDKINLA